MAWACSRRNSGSMPPWTMAKRAAAGRRPGRLGPRGPPEGQGRGAPHFGLRRRVAGALVQADHDVHPQRLLEAHHGLRGEEMLAPSRCERKSTPSSVMVRKGGQAEDLDSRRSR